MSQWYAVRTATRREITALKALTGKGFAVFLPMLTRWSTPARRQVFEREPVQDPLIPGYLFVLCDDTAEAWAEVRALEGVHGFLQYEVAPEELQPMPIPAAVVLGLQAEEREGLYDDTRAKRVRYRPKKGDRVQITAGPYYTCFARVVDTPRGERVQLLIEDLERGRVEAVDHVARVA